MTVSSTTNDGEWYNERQQVTMNENEQQQIKTSDNEWSFWLIFLFF